MVFAHIGVMNNPMHFSRITMVFVTAGALCGCQTISTPKIDIMKTPEFSEEAANIGTDYPDVKDAPLAPTDIRSDKQWDVDARALQALRDSPDGIKMQSGPTDTEARIEFNALKAKAQAYKNDDPNSGPVDPNIPNYKRRR